MTRRLGRLVGLLCALPCTLPVAGCSDDDPEPKVAPSPTTTSSPPPVSPPTTTAPPQTAQPVVDTPRGVVRRWIRLYNKLLTDGDGTEIRTISRTCQPCLATIEKVEGIYDVSGLVRGGTYHLRSLDDYGSGAGLTALLANIRSDATEYRASSDAAITRLKGGELVIEFDTKRVVGEWVVSYEVQVAS